MRQLGRLILPCLVLAGCAGKSLRQPAFWPLPAISDSPIRGQWIQSLELERNGHTMDLVAVLECDGRLLTLVGLTPLGQRLVRITWAGTRVEVEKDSALQIDLPVESILRDVLFVHWPESSLQKALAESGWSAVFQGPRRRLHWHGKPWLSVTPDTTETGERVLVNHLAEKFKVYVTTVERNEP